MQTQLNNEIDVDSHNSRIVGYIQHSDHALSAYLTELQQLHQTTKTILYVTENNRQLFENDGYCEEGKINKFFLGKDAYILSKFYESNRQVSSEIEEKNTIIQTVLADRKIVSDTPPEPPYRLEFATALDAEPLAALYRSVFAYYPTNVFDPQYLADQMGEHYVFIVARNGQEIVSAASAVIKPEFGCAEITDCATLPDFRGKQLTSLIIREIENHLISRKIHCLFSLTRASSIGMNMTVHRLGYTYQGRLVNNCMIYSGLEDMNVWTKYVEGKPWQETPI